MVVVNFVDAKAAQEEMRTCIFAFLPVPKSLQSTHRLSVKYNNDHVSTHHYSDNLGEFSVYL